MNFINLTDGYKLDHRRQYPKGTEYVYSNFTPRSSRIPGATSVVFFGLQYFLAKYFMEKAQEFFDAPRDQVTVEYERMLDGYFGPGHGITTDHIGALHDLGYIPLRFCALPEGTSVPLKVPMFTVENTHPDFFWVTNYFETLISTQMWQACTSASLAKRMRKILTDAAAHSGGDPAFVDWQAHDFSFRGMPGQEAAALSGAGHLLSFKGTDSLPAIDLLKDYYSATGLIGGSVPATEHSVMCAGGKDDELETFNRLLELYPKGIVSVVSDTWDLWNVLGNILPKLKDKIMARDGKLVIRPDSGDPTLIICGNPEAKYGSLEYKGVVEVLWDLFGGTQAPTGQRILDSHIGTIYGDSITEERAFDICYRLRNKGFASTNVVFGVGSYSYQYVTRDTHGFAIKATWAMVSGEERFLSKNPVTDNGVKKSAQGRLAVVKHAGSIVLMDSLYKKDEGFINATGKNLLQPVWENGKFLRTTTLDEIRARI